ncbi:hypothetical protein [Pseudomonas amygdali]|uniref:hypothetical protein n=1 Tax=Pseudomonas amygdali TaxID=47877 RepID=UPI001FB74E30|nr:hypothetical protein [Pseudomonas amygdali]
MFKKLQLLLTGNKGGGQNFYVAETSPVAMNDAELREWGLRLLSVSPDPSRLQGYGIDQFVIMRAQFDDEALAELRKWSGISQPGQNQ